MQFYLGTHHPHWLTLAGVPLFVSVRRLRNRKRLPRAATPWALDSGGFSELTEHGTWTIAPQAYVDLVRRFREEIGQLEWAAAQDWMCEPAILQRTGLDVAEHQRRTVQNYLELRELAPELPWVPVLQGWTMGEYFDHVEEYARAGVDLRQQARVGLGTVCRRQHTIRTSLLVRQLVDEGLRLHAFGFKVTGIRDLQPLLVSADSMAWSFQARRERRGQQNSLETALDWYHSLPLESVQNHAAEGQRFAKPSSQNVLATGGMGLLSGVHGTHGKALRTRSRQAASSLSSCSVSRH